MGLERKERVGGRSVVMGKGTKEAMCEDMMFARYDAAIYCELIECCRIHGCILRNIHPGLHVRFGKHVWKYT